MTHRPMESSKTFISFSALIRVIGHKMVARHTYDNLSSVQVGQLYFEVNQAMRAMAKADLAWRIWAFKAWGSYVKCLCSALQKIPVRSGTVYRGWPMLLEDMERSFFRGRRLTFGAFTSVSHGAAAAARMAGPNGLVLKIYTYSGRDTSVFSFFASTEKELVLMPSTRFLVVSEPVKKAVQVQMSETEFEMMEVFVISLEEFRGAELVS